jgi:hypothetical protein
MSPNENLIRHLDDDGNGTFEIVAQSLPEPPKSHLDGETLIKPNIWAYDQWTNND